MTGGARLPEPARDPPLRALLIGIDHYLPPRAPGIPRYGHLRGGVLDVERMERWLRRGLGVPAQRIVRLVAPRGVGRPAAPAAELPTYERMVEELRRLAAGARPGEQVWIYYAGHGGRAPAAMPERKGPRGLDECLVPWNVGDPAARYLRDLELALLLAEIERGGAFATVVLDCCHSGGAVRADQRVRGVDKVDRTARPPSLVLPAARRTMVRWRHAHLAETRELDPTGYVLLAACRPGERTVEEPGDDGEPGGAFTRSLLRSLGAGAGAESTTYDRLHQGVTAEIRSRFPNQTPQIEGERERSVLAGRRLPVERGVAVIGPVEAGESPGGGVGGPASGAATVRLATGRVHGIEPGARFTVRPAAPAAGGGAETEPAVVEVRRVGASVSEATVLRTGADDPEPGDRAELVDRGPAASRLTVRLALEEGASAGAAEALERLRRRLASPAVGWLRPLAPGGAAPGATTHATAAFEARVGASGRFELCDAGGRELPHTGPPLPAAGPDSAALAARRLDHLARWETLRRLENREPGAFLRRALELSLERLPSGWDPHSGRPARGVALDPAPGIPEVETRTWVALRIHNRSPDELNVAVLDLRPDWSVAQVFPAWRGGWFQPVDADGSLWVPLRTTLPEALHEGIDTLLVLATTGPVNHRWLEMGPVAEVDSEEGAEEIERFRGRRDSCGGGARADSPASELGDGADGWTTASVDLRVVRS